MLNFNLICAREKTKCSQRTADIIQGCFQKAELLLFAMSANALVQKVKNLPPVSHTALKLVNLLDQPSVSNDEIVSALKYDNILTAKLLRACNSPYFGLEEAVASVDQAVFILGHQQILHIVLTLAFGSVMTIPSPAYMVEVNELWRHSLISAAATEVVLNEISELNADVNVAFTASLLHDIGKLVLGQVLSADELAEIRDRIERKQISGTEAEKEVLATDHGEVGAVLLQKWRLPENIVEAVANHHRPVLEPRTCLSVVTHIANGVAHRADLSPAQNIHDLQIADNVAAEFSLDKAKLESVAVIVRESFERVEQFMTMA